MYELKIQATTHGEGQSRFPRPEETVTSISTEVKVPAGEETYDLGMFTVPVN